MTNCDRFLAVKRLRVAWMLSLALLGGSSHMAGQEASKADFSGEYCFADPTSDLRTYPPEVAYLPFIDLEQIGPGTRVSITHLPNDSIAFGYARRDGQQVEWTLDLDTNRVKWKHDRLIYKAPSAELLTRMGIKGKKIKSQIYRAGEGGLILTTTSKKTGLGIFVPKRPSLDTVLELRPGSACP